jgi:hypothetical protein
MAKGRLWGARSGRRGWEGGGRTTGRELKCDRVTRGRDEQPPKRKPWTRASWRAGENAGRCDISVVVYSCHGVDAERRSRHVKQKSDARVGWAPCSGSCQRHMA